MCRIRRGDQQADGCADELRRRYVEYDEVPASVLKFLEMANRR
jgi:hypothetical protein